MWIFDAKINSITSERGSVILLVHRNDIVKYVYRKEELEISV